MLPHPATYGLSRRLGGVEYLDAHFTAHRFAPHSHPGFAIGTVRRGACRIWHRGASHVARRGDLVLIEPGAPHSADPAGIDSWDYCAIYFSVEDAHRWWPTQPMHPGFRAVVERDVDLAMALERLCAMLAEDPEHDRSERAFGAFIDALRTRHLVARPRDAVARDESDASAPWLARRHIDAHFTRALRIEELAAISGRSPFSLIRAFTRSFGISPYAYLTHRRVARAQELLRAGEPISDTAFAVGFSDQSHLTRFFRRVVGVPPGVWLKGVRADAAWSRRRMSGR